MKKVTAIFLLSLMLLLAVHPVLALHYCGDKLYSFSLVQATGNSHSCCCDVIEQEGKCSHETNDIPTQKLYHSCGLSDMHNTCCNIQLLTLNTDDYLNKSDHFVSPITTNYFDEVIALSIPLFKLSKSETDAFTPLLNFPPKGLFLQELRLRTYFCIYRI
jgi:hypothetical protein